MTGQDLQTNKALNGVKLRGTGRADVVTLEGGLCPVNLKTSFDFQPPLKPIPLTVNMYVYIVGIIQY